MNETILETIKCNCEICGIEYEKPLNFKIWNEQHPNVFLNGRLNIAISTERKKNCKH